MLRTLITTLCLSAAALLQAQPYLIVDTVFDRKAHETDFAFGADIGFVSQMESWGTQWLDKNGRQKDILQILKEQGINNIRLRVWTTNGFCGKNDVVNMCQRAKAKGMGVMIDFHYSDTWADPGSQTIPSAWTDHSPEALAQNIYDHTYDVLSAVKATGANVRWVQVGNETKRGMLYPVGQTNQGGSVNFAKFVQSGYNAVKAVDPNIQVIVHLPDGHDNSLYRSIFDGLKKNGAKWDIIGMSAYPRWSHLDGPTMVTKTMANIRDLKSRYGTPVMVVETGHYWHKALEGNQYLADLMTELIADGDLGCFYWEPESMSGYELGAWDPDTRRPTIAMDAYLGLRYSEVDWIMKARLTSPTRNTTLPADEEVLLKAYVQHVQNKTPRLVFHLDKKVAGILTQRPYTHSAGIQPIGSHFLFASLQDDANHKLMTDTIVFHVGANVSLGQGEFVQGESEGEGTLTWVVYFPEAGRYALNFLYHATTTRQCQLLTDGGSEENVLLSRINNLLSIELNITDKGTHVFSLISQAGDEGLTVDDLRIFPLDGQDVPTEGDATGIEEMKNEESSMHDYAVYDLSGRLLYRTSDASLADAVPDGKVSAVVYRANWVGGTPYIVRKQRLK